MTQSNSAKERDIAHVLHPFTNLALHQTRGPTIITSGKGVMVKDSEGKEYIEAMSGLWCASLGYGAERLIKAAERQLRTLPYSHLFAHKSNEPAIDLSEKLIALAPATNPKMSKVFLANSGSEAVDTAIKLVWYYHNAIKQPKKKLILSRHHGYHGVTVAGASLTGLPILHKSFDLPIIPVKHLAVPHFPRFGEENESEEQFTDRLITELKATIKEIGADNIGAMIAEPLQGAGGVILPPKNYFAKLQPILKENNILLIADEVITGFCRTGRFWGSETYGLNPDIMTMAKALSAAYLPISAVMINETVANAVIKQAGELGSFGTGFTYGGHPVSCAVALETLKIYEEEKIVDHVASLAGRVHQHLATLRQHPLVGNARGVGLIGAVELWRDKKKRTFFAPEATVAAKVAALGEKHGVILRPLVFDSVAFCPPLIINEQELDELFKRFTAALDEA
ncbi:MAG: aminotransferase, partial [Alphaproteobacteria bacterium]|nr:aminotransferase [Alphaproteobacteria bacterium]